MVEIWNIRKELINQHVSQYFEFPSFSLQDANDLCSYAISEK